MPASAPVARQHQHLSIDPFVDLYLGWCVTAHVIQPRWLTSSPREQNFGIPLDYCERADSVAVSRPRLSALETRGFGFQFPLTLGDIVRLTPLAFPPA